MIKDLFTKYLFIQIYIYIYVNCFAVYIVDHYFAIIYINLCENMLSKNRF